jgi:hypothetical protein
MEKKFVRASMYGTIILQLTDAKLEETPAVESRMREIYRTLDGLDRRTFAREAKKALKELRNGELD